MSPDFVITIARQALEVTILILAFILLPVLAVGLVVSMFQAATQINEMTLSFVPKLMVMFFLLIMGGSWLLQILMNYTLNLIESIHSIIF